MSGRLLSFKDYLGGADNVQVIEMFPRSQKTFTYNFGSNVSAWDFSADFHSIVLDTVTYDRVTGDPNFADTSVIGYFNNETSINAGTYINEGSASSGVVAFTIPSDRYTGPLKPNARDNVVMTVVSFEWTTNATPPQKDSHRWAIIERWEPGVSPADPTLSNAYIQIGSGAISSYTTDASTDANRVAGVYSGVVGVTSATSEGSGHTFVITVSEVGATTVNILTRGKGFAPGDTIKILDTSLGAGGGADITVTVTGTA